MKRVRFTNIVIAYIVACHFMCLNAQAQVDGESRPAYADTLNIIPAADSLMFNADAAEKNYESRTPPLREVPDSVVANMKADEDFFYANDPSFWKKQPPPDDSALIKLFEWLSKSQLMKWLLYLLVAALVIFAIYQVMVVNDFFISGRKRARKKESAINPEELEAADLDRLINNAIQDKQYRLAIRFMYLKTLRILHEEQMIQLNAKSTNEDYIEQMGKKELGPDFRRLTRIYEFAWYGEYPLNEQQFAVAQQNFDSFNRAR